MNKFACLFPSVVVTCVCLFQYCAAQTAYRDSSSQPVAFNNAAALYNTSIGIQAPVYTGPEYYFYDPHIKGTAYFMDVKTFTPGNIYYAGTLYKKIAMLYDLNTDEVVVILPSQVSRFSLLKERVQSFDFLNNHFININADTIANNTVLKSGYYDQLYSGKSEILAKYSKSIQTTTSNIEGLENYFTSSKDYFIKINSVYYSVGGQGSLLDLLKSRKKQLKQFIKANHIKYRDNPEEAMVRIATYYDHLAN